MHVKRRIWFGPHRFEVSVDCIIRSGTEDRFDKFGKFCKPMRIVCQPKGAVK